ncbi:hypothetical protein, variant [Phialophora macrospora]|uniref:DNA (cytosine-5-)-methyltransferase n=1 Tax=Phialophora macrospora TaxID=1851006 RepID=A0A0D2GA53_9EURO|nr:hypothetical protein, variant [Phialophora macrospora]
MPRLWDLDDDTPSVHEYTEASGSLHNTSDDEVDSEETDASTKKEVAVLPPPRKTSSRTARSTGSNRPTLSRDIFFQQQETVLIRTLQQLESPDEVRQSYPPRFSDGNLSGVASSYLPESQILNEFIALEPPETNDDDDHFNLQDTFFFEFEVENFCIYQSPKACSGAKDRNGLEGRYESLHIVATYQDDTDYFIDGTLESADNRRSFIRGEVIDVNIGAMEDTTQHSADESIWVQTTESKKKGYWYRLRRPSKAYERYWSDYLWVANFTKYFIDFLHVNLAAGVSVHLGAFQSSFWTWLEELHGTKISEWHRQCGERTDFRQHVLSYALFLRRRASCLEKCDNIINPRLSHQLWDDVVTGKLPYDRQAISSTEKTVVTRHVAHSFLKSFPHWRKEHQLLQVVENCAEVEDFAEDRRRKWKFPNKLQFSQRANFKGTGRHKVSKAAWLLEEAGIENQPIRIHDPRELLRAVIIVRIPLMEWNQYDFRYAWVRGASLSTVSVVWLVLPTDTTCGNPEDMTFYPIGNELFFTDECNCRPVSIGNVIKIVKASPFIDHAQEGSEVFIHSLYRPSQEVHVKATESELSCHCQKILGATRKTPATTKRPAREETSQSTYPKMKVCALCCGCGLLDHAFCDASLAETVLAVEHDGTAARSHMANNHSNQCQYIIDSVNPALQRFMAGEKPLPHHIDCLIAGPPCQGWSVLNQSKGKDHYESEKNCSILANILSWIEVFLPAYVLIENVPNMQKSQPNACAQAICHLVALGYQVRKSVRIDCEVGGVSIRKRLFIVAAAPDASLPDDLTQTHYYRDCGGSESEPRTSWSAISDLKPIKNDTILNHEDAEHVPLQQLKINWDKNISFRNLVTKIETSLSQAYYSGNLSAIEKKFFRSLSDNQQERSSKVLKRVNHDKPFRTIATTISPMDARFGGEVLHPFQNRLLSLREICRAMGVPDSFLLAGTIAQKHKQLGNGVPGALAHGWGVAFGKAWMATIHKGGGAEVDEEPSPPLNEAPGIRYSKKISGNMSVTTTAQDATTGMRKQATFEMTYREVKTVDRRRARRVVYDSDDEAEERADTRHISRKVTTTRSSEVTITEESRPAAGQNTPNPTSRRGSPSKYNKMVAISSDEEEYWSALDDQKTPPSPPPHKQRLGPSTNPFPRRIPARSSRRQRTWEPGRKREAHIGPGSENDGSDESDLIYVKSRRVKKTRV